ncbi:GNAT family protein [Devosia sp.]|uniref:GNAT family N-acetyltransferase n=1 Tax=Devosia sp. TaxID=1871048 RepID=UPI0026010108|nr:GNAT family protein [Devosia sp.]MCR6633908.1 GNAT family N-acetyltransferase [Devosia sp.]
MLRLKPLDASDLPIVEPWFDDAETQRWLGGREWPALGFRLQGPDRQLYLALDETTPVGLLDCETYPDNSASFAVVTAPEMRNRGIGRAILSAFMAEPAYSQITRFFAGIERGNVASAALMLRCGFVEGEEDEDGFTDFEYRRS